MADLDELLRSDIALAAARAASGPDFDAVRGRGRSRRRRARAVVAGFTIAAVAAAGLGFALRPTGDPHPAPVRPGPTPAHVKQAQPSARQIVDDSRSVVQQMMAVPGHEDVRATLWRLCATKTCATSYAAVAVTDDGFKTRHLLGLPQGSVASLSVAGPNTFAVNRLDAHPLLLHADGRSVKVQPPDPTAPLATGEVALSSRNAGGNLVPLGVDPATGRSHRLPSPGDLTAFQQAGDRLEGLLRGSVYVSSLDGGASWQRHDLTRGSMAWYRLVPSASSEIQAVLRGTGGATLFPFLSADRDNAGAWDTVTPPRKPTAYVDGSVVLPGGELLLYVDRWSNPHYQGGNHDPGLWVSNGSDWADMLRALPFRQASPDLSEHEIHRIQQGLYTFAGSALGDGHATVYVADGSHVYAVTGADAATWAPVPAR